MFKRSILTTMEKQRRTKILLSTILGCSAVIVCNESGNKKRKRNAWVRKWLPERREKGEYDFLLNQLVTFGRCGGFQEKPENEH